MTNLATVKDLSPAPELKEALRGFYEAYTTALDDGDYERWATFFTEDAQYQITSRENFDQGLPLAAMSCDGRGMILDRVTALEKVLVYEPRIWRRFVSSVRIVSQTANDIHSRANFMLIESLLDRDPQINMVGMYVDVIVPRGSSFLIQDRKCVYDNSRILTTLFAPV